MLFEVGASAEHQVFTNPPLHLYRTVIGNFMKDVYPNTAEQEFLTLSYNRFYDLFEEMINDNFWNPEQDSFIRYCKIKEVFSIYSELLNYEPLKQVVEMIRKTRPPMEAEIGSELFKFIRNVVLHFPFFTKWNDVWVSQQIINWNKQGQSIDKFLQKYTGHEVVKYRFWELSKKKMTSLTINFPAKYECNLKIYLKDFLSERDGIKFSLILMKQILNTQVEEIFEKKDCGSYR